MPNALRLALALALLAAPAAATTFQMVSDRDLADQADVIVQGAVVAVEPAPVDGRPATDFQVDVSRVLKGDLAGSTIMVRVPGGVRADGVGLKIWGAPDFREGERALLFLRAGADGIYRPLHLMLGAFHVHSVGGRPIALRHLHEAAEVGSGGVRPGSDEPRDLPRFGEWLADRAEGLARRPDYFVAPQGSAVRQAIDKFVLLRWSGDDRPIRWFAFDRGETVEWRVHEGAQTGLGLDDTVARFADAMAIWNDEPRSIVRYSLAGTTDANGGFDHDDGVNAILFEDPHRGNPDSEVDGTFECGSGGVIAIGGPYFFEEVRGYRGQTFHEAVEGDIVTNDGTTCYFSSNPTVANEVFAHELGHTLGLGHSQDPEALMWSRAHNDGRGAQLHPDDADGVFNLYPPPANKVPGAPRQLTGRALSTTEARLTWRDGSSDEDNFVVEVKRGKSFVQIGEVTFGQTGFTVIGLARGTAYQFRIRAQNSAGFSKASNVARVTTKK
jgi:matrixin/fibronectin type III domain protein